MSAETLKGWGNMLGVWRRIHAVGIACTLCLDATQLHAGGLPAKKLPTIYVVGKVDPANLAQADAAYAGVVDQAQITNRPISRPAEVLEVVPGLIATQHSGDA